MVSSHRASESLSTVVSFLSLEFITPSVESKSPGTATLTADPQSAVVYIKCCCHELRAELLQGYGQLSIELSFPTDQTNSKQDKFLCDAEENSLNFIKDLLRQIDWSRPAKEIN